MAKDMKMTDKIKETIEATVNTARIKKGMDGFGIKRPALVGLANFSGKKLKIAKSLVRRGKQHTIPAGTAWESIDPWLQGAIAFKQTDFK